MIAAGREATVVAANEVGEVIFASPAIAGDTLLVRGRHHLFAFSDSAH